MRNFKEKDFSGSGQYLVLDRDKHIKDTGYLSSIMFKVGYCHDKIVFNERSNQTVCLISMTDGWTMMGYYKGKKYVPFANKKIFVDWMNSIKEKDQQYRFATHNELLRVTLYQNKLFKKSQELMYLSVCRKCLSLM